MSEPFDPYLHWLGIRDPQRPPNYYRLLGVELFESDPLVLTNAADRQMAHVRTFQTGPRSAESQRILNELAAAKICLLNPQKKAAYDARLREELGLAAAVPLGPPVVATGTAGAGEVVDLSFVYEQAGSRPASRPFMPAVWLLVAAFTAMAVVLAGLIVYILTTAPGVAVPRVAEAVNQQASSEASQGRAAAEVVASKSGKPTPGQSAPSPAKTATSGSPRAGGGKSGEESAKTEPGGGASGVGLPSVAPPRADLPQRPALPGAQGGSMPIDPVAKPLPEVIPPVAEALAEARQALRARAPVQALAHLDVAEKAAEPNEKPEVDRLRLAAKLLETYWRSVRTQLAQLKPGERVEWGGQPATVVRASEESLVVDRNGRAEVLALEALPREVVEPLAEAGLPAESPASLLAKAAFELFDATGDRQTGAELLRKAAAAGQPIELLAQEVPRELAGELKSKPAGGRLPPPEAAAVEAAVKKVREVFKEQYAGAQTPAEKSGLGEALFRQAVETRDDPVVRYVLLREAEAVAVAAGNGSLLRQTIDALAKDFEMEAGEELARALASAVDMVLPAAVRHGLAQTALEAGRQALRAEDFERARRLAKTAQILAGKARDTATARRAGDLAATIPWLKQEFEKAQQASRRLAEDANHPQANLVLGMYTALVKEDWAKGLPLLAKGSDNRLRSLAEAELALDPNPAPPEMVKLADLWRSAIKAVEAPLQGAVARRALFWYERALPSASGFTKTYLEQRIAGLRELEATRRRP